VTGGFPVQNLDAYERRWRRNLLLTGALYLVVGVVVLAASDGVGVAFGLCGLVLGATIGALFGLAAPIEDRIRLERVRDLQPRALSLAWSCAVGGSVLVLWLILHPLGVDLPFAFFAGVALIAEGVLQLIRAPRESRFRRNRYEGDLRELAALEDPKG